MLHDTLPLHLGQLGKDWQRENAISVQLGDRANIAGELLIGLLLMDRNGVVDARSNAAIVQVLEETVAMASGNDIEVPHGLAVRRSTWELQVPNALEVLVIELGHTPPACVSLLQGLQLLQEDRCLHGVQTRISALLCVVVLLLCAPCAPSPGASRQRVVVRAERTTVAEGPEVLPGVEAETAGVTDATYRATFVGHTVCLRGIFNDRDATRLSDAQHGVHVCSEAIEVDRHDELRLICDRSLELRDIHLVGAGYAIHKLDRGTQRRGAKTSGNEGVRLGNDFVAWTNAQVLVGQIEGVGARVHTDAMLHADKLAEGLLELL
mmetsp:Transcript_20200/g.30347  ORF Transcript_20200/g.30347 Transcript_20200/m.30347 type:complete len:322 (+) Transcript_20200:366-1331(+)